MILEGRSALDFKSPDEVAKLQVKARQLFAACQKLGHHPIWAQAIESGMIAICFDVMRHSDGPKQTQWHKTFIADGDVADVKAYTAQMRTWKDKVLKEIAIHLPSASVQNWIRRDGLKAVQEALKR